MSSAQTSGGIAIPWGGSGDINAGFAFLLDCVVNLFVLSALLASFGFPLDLIQSRIIPGALVGIIVGNLMSVRLARRVAHRTGNPNVTAMPLGLDLPTTVGFAVAIVGPLFLALQARGLSVSEAATMAWYVGMAGTIWVGIIKFGLSYFGGLIQRILPMAALLGSMVGIAIVWLGANAILGVFSLPEVGLLSLGIMVYALIAGHRMPGALPGAVAAIIFGTTVYYVLGGVGLLDSFAWPQPAGLGLAFPLPSLGGVEQLFGETIFYLAVILPFALLVTASTINLTAGANLVGDDLKSGELIRADAVGTIVGALFGGVVQTTPYFGHPTYKRMGARCAYSLGVAVVLAIGGVIGIIQFLIDVLPDAAIKPVLIVVACDIVRLAFKGVKSDDSPGVAFAAMPAIIAFAHVKVGDLYRAMESGLAGARDVLSAGGDAAGAAMLHAQVMLPAAWQHEYALMGAMARGYILTGILWAAAVSYVINKQFREGAVAFFLAGGLALFGIIHSVLDNSAIYLPWNLSLDSTFLSALPYRFAAGYAMAGLVILGFARLTAGQESSGPASGQENN